ncbi:MAG: snoaL-like domain protein [Deltaproteobacteria bacterium]|nr:snoaL-like domain protein [Deltaproteobacteria bacterium]
MQDLREIEAIKQLKYKYLRCVDLKRWDELRECFAEDATSAYGDGQYSFRGREQIMEFLIARMDRPTFITFHHCHHPEIQLTSSTTAVGIWAMEGMGIDLQAGTINHCAAYYHDEYVQRNGQWQIALTGYDYLYDAVQSLADTPSLRLTQNRFAK